jgi:DNA-directed RNA polymerase specialized sigma24 family protein
MEDRAELILALTPQLRRHARLLTGSQTIGDEYVRICLEAVLQEPDRLAGEDLKKALFQVFHLVWDRINSDVDRDSPADIADPAKRLEKGLLELTPVDRRALLLVTLEGYSIDDAATILRLSAAETMHCVERARERLGHWNSVPTLIIEDESVFAMELETILNDMGHSVVEVARHVDDALRAARAHRPGLVLADIDLGDRRDGIEAAQRILQVVDVPLVFVTGHPDRLLTGGRPEPVFVVPKPIDAQSLKVTIAHILALYDSPERAAQHNARMLDKLSRLSGNVIPFPGPRTARR